MTPADRLEARLRAPRRHPAVIAYLTAGYPSKEGFAELLQRVATVADAIEIGVPFTDPMADGITIQDTSRKALEQGVSLRWILSMLRETPLDAPVLLMSYLNPLLAYGLDRLPRDAAEAGVTGLIVPDLPWEEGAELREHADAAGIAIVQLVTPATPDERLAKLAGASRGFVYAVTMRGTTGGSVLPGEISGYLERVRAFARAPVCAGFGIRAREHVEGLAAHVDGVIVGTAVLDVLSKGGDPVAFLRGLSDG